MARALYLVAALLFGVALGWAGHNHLMAGSGHWPPPPPGGPGFGPDGDPGDELFAQLGCTVEQLAKIRAITGAHRATHDALQHELEAARTAFEQGLRTGAPRAELTALFQTLTAKKEAAEHDFFATMLDVHDVLTPAQVQRLLELRPPPPPGPQERRP